MRGTRTSGTIREFRDPPCRPWAGPAAPGSAATGVSPRATRYAYKTETDDSPRVIVRADSADSRSASRSKR